MATRVMRRLEELGQISDEPGRLTRTFCSPAMRRANDHVGSWMRQAGMTIRQDAIGNLVGHYPGQSAKCEVRSAKCEVHPPPSEALRRTISPSFSVKSAAGDKKSKVLLLGSHLDTVRDAGKFDGALGVLVAIACVQKLHERGSRLPFDIDVLGFGDEEGIRYSTACLGSRVLAGTFDRRDLKRRDANGVTMREAIREFGGRPQALSGARFDPERLLGYAEIHIEQGPVLEQQNLAVGVVSAIGGQTRARISFTGQAGHAGTTPMNLRRDALCGAAEFISVVEALARKQRGLVATVGELKVLRGASNVIPGQVQLSLDVRHAEDARRRAACAELKKRGRAIASERKLRFEWKPVSESPAIRCDRWLSQLMKEAVQRQQGSAVSLPSGAGHDAAAIAAIAPVTMLFVRCKNGLSHHPAEYASKRDVGIAMAVLVDFLRGLAKRFGTSCESPTVRSRGRQSALKSTREEGPPTHVGGYNSARDL